MPEHLSEEMLNCYLDGYLAADEQEYVEDHLAVCSSCCLLFENLRSLFRQFEDWEDQPVLKDFSAVVIQEIQTGRQKKHPSWWLFPLGQIAASLGLLIGLSGMIKDLITKPIGIKTNFYLDFSFFTIAVFDPLQNWMVRLNELGNFQPVKFHLPNIPVVILISICIGLLMFSVFMNQRFSKFINLDEKKVLDE